MIQTNRDKAYETDETRARSPYYTKPQKLRGKEQVSRAGEMTISKGQNPRVANHTGNRPALSLLGYEGRRGLRRTLK